MADEEKGKLVMTIGIYKGLSKQYKYMLYANLALVLALPVIFYFAFQYVVGADPTYSLMGALMVFLLIFWGFLFFQWLTYRITEPVRVYERGLAMKLSLLQRLMRRPSFVRKEELDGVYLIYMSQESADRPDPKKAHRITFTGVQKRRAYSILARPAADILRAAEYAEKEWGLPVYNKPRPYKIRTTER